MIVKKQQIASAVERPNPDHRFFLFYGPDDAGSRSLGTRLLQALGAERFDLAASAIKDDPAGLADEAGALALFGGPRAIWIDPAGDEITEAVAALLEGGPVESVTVAIAGGLKKGSPLLKLVDSSGKAVGFASYPPEGRDSARLVVSLGKNEGLAIDLAVADRVADEANGNQAVIMRELAKYALYLDASSDRPKTLTHEVLDDVGCGGAESDLQRLGDLALDGDLAELLEELDTAGISAKDGVTILRALGRRLMMVAPLGARIAAGEERAAVMASPGRPIFWKEKEFIERLLRIWPPDRLARLVDRTAEIERALMLSDVPEVAAIGEHFVSIGRFAQRRR